MEIGSDADLCFVIKVMEFVFQQGAVDVTGDFFGFVTGEDGSGFEIHTGFEPGADCCMTPLMG